MIWIRSANEDVYNFTEAFETYDELDWSKNANYKVGDIVYIYGASPYSKIMYKTEVIKIDIPFDEIIDDLIFYEDSEFKENKADTFVRLKFISNLEDLNLNSDTLQDNGLSGHIQGPIKVNKKLEEFLKQKELENLIKEINELSEINPDEHDGSYEYVREVVKSLSTISEEELTIDDLSLLYFATVGTFSRGYSNKIKNIEESNLSDSEKSKLKQKFDAIFEKSESKFYENSQTSEEKRTMGMFGTGIGKLKVSNEDSRNFINMCIKILNTDNENLMIDLVEETLGEDVKHLGMATVSQILHCLKPTVFPILTSNTINKVFGELGIDLVSPTDITHFAKNTRIIKQFRDEHFQFKNYRTLDKYFWDYYDSAEDGNTLTYIVSKEEWITLISDSNIFYKEDLNFIKRLYDVGGEASPADIANDFGKYHAYFNLLIPKLSKRIINRLEIDDQIYRTKKSAWFQLLFIWRRPSDRHLWKLRPELYAAIEEKYDFLKDYVIPEDNNREENNKKENDSEKDNELYDKSHFLKEVFIDEQMYDTLETLLKRKKNIILQGAPGVGKTFLAKRLAYSLLGERNDKYIETVQFHQSYSYEDFIQGIRPNEDGTFTIKNGVFYNFCKKAENDSEKDYYFIIDEINRGNISKIFGELMMLLENDKRGKDNQISLLYTDKYFSIPENVFLIGTMNTADRSLAILDYALRRRFSFITLEPAFNNSKFREHLLGNGAPEELVDLIINQLNYLNNIITDDINLGKGFTIGHSYFTDFEPNEDWYRNIIEYDIAPLLEEYWFDDLDTANGHIEYLRNE